MLQSEKTASNIEYDNSTSKLMAENVQAAIDEVTNVAKSGKLTITIKNMTISIKEDESN